MDLAVEDTTAWSEAIFGSVALGDKRLTRRLIQIGKQLSSTPSGSLSGSCGGQDALIEGSYRFYETNESQRIKLQRVVIK